MSKGVWNDEEGQIGNLLKKVEIYSTCRHKGNVSNV